MSTVRQGRQPVGVVAGAAAVAPAPAKLLISRYYFVVLLMTTLETCFLDLLARSGPPDTPNPVLAARLWAEISAAYSGAKRHYHTLDHLRALLGELTPHRAAVADWEGVLFALFYHDAVYNVLRADNEERSAELAAVRLLELGQSPARVVRCTAQILATKHHETSGDFDTGLLVDADLAVLGQPWPAYQRYAEQVRAEYSIYPDLLYKPGRRKVLHHFLAKARLYQTAPFFELYEAAARANLARELTQL